jgi:hypothetical protein
MLLIVVKMRSNFFVLKQDEERTLIILHSLTFSAVIQVAKCRVGERQHVVL